MSAASDSTKRVGEVRGTDCGAESEQGEPDKEMRKHNATCSSPVGAASPWLIEQQPQHVGGAVLSDDDLVEQEQDERGIDREAHMGMPAA